MGGSIETPLGYDVTDLREKLKGWTSKPQTLNDFVQVNTADCQRRAMEYIPAKWGVLGTNLDFDSKPLKDVMAAADALSKPAFDGRSKILSLKTQAKWGGAEQTKFSGFHYVLVIAAGADTNKKKFWVVYDPDVTATTKSDTAWKSLWKSSEEEADKEKPSFTDADKGKAASAAAIEKMVLGEKGDLGALVRYYYYES